MSELKCPFCGEPRLRFSCGVNRFACGTVGPYLNDGEGEYETGHTCDIHTYSRLFKEMEQRLAAAEEAKLDAQDDARAQFGRYMDCDKAYRALQDRLAAAEAERIWTCGCGIVNGVNLATCRVCGRKEGEQC